MPDHDNASEQHLPVNGGFHLNHVEDFDDVLPGSRSSFLSIHFRRSTSSGEAADSTSSGEDGDDFVSLFTSSLACPMNVW